MKSKQLRTALASLLAAGTALLSANSALAYPTYYVQGTEGLGLWERTGPGYDNYPSVRLLGEGTPVEIACQTWGELVTPTQGSASRIWDRLPSGYYVSDDYINTPRVNEFTPGIGVCPPSAAIRAPGTGGTYFEGESIATSFECTQAKDAGIASCTDSNGGSGATGRLDTSQVGTRSYVVTAVGGDGASATAEIHYVVAAPPTASISSPTSGGTYPQNAIVKTSFSCDEGTDGPGLETCTDSNGAAGGTGSLDTSTTGPHTYTVTAKSRDGAITHTQIEYTVATVKTTCGIDEGRVTYRPGLTDTPAVQAITIKGALAECSGAAYSSAKYTATLQSSEPIGCSVLGAEPGAPATGTAKMTWLPKSRESKSTATISLDVTGAASAPLTANLITGAFSPATATATIQQIFEGAAECGALRNGREKAVRKATFHGASLTVY